MIDTDKYEGHTEGPWVWEGGILTNHQAIHWCYGTKGVDIVDIGHRYIGPMVQEPDLQLLADAPLLLAEVERHRPPKVDGKYMAWSDSHPKHDRRTWIEQVMEGITDAGYWTWVNWQLQYGDEEE